MTDCDYCAESFADEDTYLQHLKAEHEDELGKIDQRRIQNIETDQSFNIGAVILVTIIVAGFAVVGYLIMIGGGSGDEPYGQIHEHGTMEIIIDGDHLDLTQPAFVEQDSHFHFHGSNDRVPGEEGRFIWHTHSHSVTIQYALDTLDIAVNDEGTQLSYDGETYDATEAGTEIIIEVDGEAVEPGSYELGGVQPISQAVDGLGDDIRIELRTNG